MTKSQFNSLARTASGITSTNRISRRQAPRHAWALPTLLLGFLVTDAKAQDVNVTLVGQWPGTVRSDETPYRVAVKGDHVFVAAGGFQVLDFRDPTDPLPVASFDMTRVFDLAISGNYAYIPVYGSDQNEGGLRIVDISDPANLRPLGWFPGGATPRVAVSGNYAYLANLAHWDGANYVGGGLHVIDITDPANPQQVGWYEDNGAFTSDVAVSGDYAYVSQSLWDGFLLEYRHALQVIDISVPSSPQWVGTYPTVSSVHLIRIFDGYAYVGINSDLEILDLSNPTNPVRVGRYANSDSDSVNDVAVVGDYAYLAAGGAGFEVVDLSNRSNPVRVGRLAMSATIGARGVAVLGNRAYLASSRCWAIDVTNPAEPKLLGGYNTAASATDLALSGNHAYVSQFDNGMHVLDVSNPARPVRLGGYRSISGYVGSVAVSGNHAYLFESHGLGSSRMQVLDISNPSSPTLVGGCDIGSPGQGYWSGLTVSGNYAYIVAGTAGFVIIDISDTTSPVRVGGYTSGWRLQLAAISGTYAYLTEVEPSDAWPPPGRLEVIDISDPTSPRRVGGTGVVGPGFGHSVTLSANRAYLTSLDGGFHVFDLSDPERPDLLGHYESQNWGPKLAISGNFAYLASAGWGGGLSGLEVIEIADPANPRLVAGWDSSYADGFGPTKLIVAGDFIYLAESTRMFHILRIDGLPAEVHLAAQAVGDTLRLKWPSTAAGFVLESSVVPTATTWDPVPGTPELNGDAFEIAVPKDGSARFFRLRKP